MIAQIFEEVRLALSQGDGDVATALRSSEPVRKLLDSTVAFGPAVVAASIVANDGTVIVAANGDGEGKPALSLPSVKELEEQASQWLLFTSLPSLLTAKVYEARRRVDINGKPAATISVGVTTALIADQARHLLVVIVATAGLVIAAAMLAVLLIANRILEQLATLTSGFEQLAAGKSPSEVKVSGAGELSTLAEKFNELSRQVRADRSRLDSDQSHLFDVVRSIQDAVVLLDANGVVLFANKEAQERLAPKNGPLEGTSLVSALDPAHPLLALVQSTVAGTEAHDVPLTLPARRNLPGFVLSPWARADPGRSADRAERFEARHRTGNRARFVESAGAPGDADFRPGSSAAQPAERDEHEARAAAPRSRRGRRKAHRQIAARGDPARRSGRGAAAVHAARAIEAERFRHERVAQGARRRVSIPKKSKSSTSSIPRCRRFKPIAD